MSDEAPAGIRPGFVRWLIIPGIALILWTLISAGIEWHGGGLRRAPKAEAKTAVAGFVSALNSYSAEYGSPVHGDAAQIHRTLAGENPRKIVFFEIRAISINAAGEIIDPWGTPYRFDLFKPDTVRVWSCGPNRQDEGGADGSDDIVSWRVH